MNKPYPRWKYHSTLPARIVSSEADEMALGDGWEESPAAFERSAEPAAMSIDPAPEQPAPVKGESFSVPAPVKPQQRRRR